MSSKISNSVCYHFLLSSTFRFWLFRSAHLLIELNRVQYSLSRIGQSEIFLCRLILLCGLLLPTYTASNFIRLRSRTCMV